MRVKRAVFQPVRRCLKFLFGERFVFGELIEQEIEGLSLANRFLVGDHLTSATASGPFS